MTHTMSATSPLRVHPTRSVRRTSGLVLVGNGEVIQRNPSWQSTSDSPVIRVQSREPPLTGSKRGHSYA